MFVRIIFELTFAEMILLTSQGLDLSLGLLLGFIEYLIKYLHNSLGKIFS